MHRTIPSSPVLRLAALFLLLFAVSCRPGPLFVYYDSGMETPRGAADRGAIDEAVRVLEAHPELNAAVIGYTDDKGPPALNKQLSLARARHVRDAMVAEDVDQERLVVAARGDLLPAASNDTEQGRAKNRRTEIFFFNPKKGDLEVQYGARIEVHAR